MTEKGYRERVEHVLITRMCGETVAKGVYSNVCRERMNGNLYLSLIYLRKGSLPSLEECYNLRIVASRGDP